ncbi:MAG: hypothetical protein HOO96_41100 [Polyangiaceae bacterium]|nr:hypothetical protein [Polyangiaceae bacterium]
MIRVLALALVTFALWLTAAAASAEPLRVLVSVSAKSGLPADRALKHATRDADRVQETFTRLGGVKKENAIRVVEPTRAELLAALARAAVIARTRRPEEVTFLFYFSGHGDRTKLHLRGEEMPLTELASAMGAVPATLRIAVTDACRNADLRAKGPTAEPGFAISMTPPPSAAGAVWVHASADGEVAQESDELEGAVFTHYWLSGLAGAADADGDKRVTLSEAYTFAYNQTLFRSAQSAGVLQRPTVDASIKEYAPLVITQLGAQAAQLRLPIAADTHYLVYTAFAHAVMAEAWSAPDRRVELGLPAGRYVVQRRGARSGAVEITLGKGQARDLDASDFRDVPEETLAKKGGEMVLRPHEASLAYGADASGFADFGQRIRAQYMYSFSDFAVGGGAEGGLANGVTDANDIETRLFGGRLAAELRFRLGSSVGLHFAGALRGLYVHQNLRRRDADVVARAGYPTESSSSAFAWGPEARASFRFDAGAPAFLELGPWASVLFTKKGDAVSPIGALGAEITVGATF